MTAESTALSEYRTYTVVGMYRTNHQVWVHSCDADSLEEAAEACREEMAANSDLDPRHVAVLSVFEGEHPDLWGFDELLSD